jgi:hypothetical protein
MSYVERLLAGYRSGLAHPQVPTVCELHARLCEVTDPTQRGEALGMLARALTGLDDPDVPGPSDERSGEMGSSLPPDGMVRNDRRAARPSLALQRTRTSAAEEKAHTTGAGPSSLR